MIKAKYDWKLNEIEPSDEFLNITKTHQLDVLASRLLWQRGIRDENELANFLQPELEKLYDPFLLYDMKKAVDRILVAIEKGEKILIYGDYDADGMTSSSVLKTALDELGAEVLVYLPNRFTDGYGPNLEVYQYFIEKEAVDLIVTVDNGVAGLVAIEWAQNHGVDVIVTDHHSLPEQLPNAYAIIHPEHPKSQYPFSYLAGVGVAFKLACALLEYIPTEMLDLVAIGTIADMVSLTDENRILVTYGLKVLANTERVGLQELMRVAGVNVENIDEETVGFQLAPRLNALGRLDDPNPAVELLTGWDEENLSEIAQMIDDKNTARKAIGDQIYHEALAMLTEEPVQVLYKEGWHKGVLGIVAGRLLDEIHKPVVLLAEENGILKGSARSIEAYDIFQALTTHRDLFLAFGGHKQAAGMTLTLEKLPELKRVMIDFIAQQQLDLSKKTILNLAASCSLNSLSMQTISTLKRLAPYGMNNPKPHFLIKDFSVLQSRQMGKENKHLKLRIEQDHVQLDAVYFGHGKESIEFDQVATQLAVTLSSNTWNGETRLQLMIDDAKASEIELLDIRSQQINFPKNTMFFANNEIKNDIIEEVLVLAEAPTTQAGLTVLSKVISQQKFKMIYFKDKIDKAYYLTGAGTREQFARLYRALAQYPEFDVRYKLKSLADFLKIPELLLIKMIQIFEELNFVEIHDGVMKRNKQAPKHEISESSIFQELQKVVKMQEFFALAPVKEIYQTLKKGDTENQL